MACLRLIAYRFLHYPVLFYFVIPLFPCQLYSGTTLVQPNTITRRISKMITSYNVPHIIPLYVASRHS